MKASQNAKALRQESTEAKLMRLDHRDGGVRPNKTEESDRAAYGPGSCAVELGFHCECHER